jgi:hypothetical protein
MEGDMNWLSHAEARIRIVGIVFALSVLIVPGMPSVLAGALEVAYPGTRTPADKRVDYYVKLLDLALRKSGIQYSLHPNETPMVSPRVIQKLETNDGIDVTWGPTTHELEQRLTPIRIPLDKGILGWRLFLIKARDRQLFEDVHSLAQMKQYAAGLQRYWSDTEILRANSLKVVDTTHYESLFDMLAADRFQYFPRGVAEIWSEQEAHANLGLEIEQHLALHYPTYTFFFVGKSNAALAHAIEQGLRIAIKDGSFDRLFEQYNGESIRRAHLNTRTVFELNNPLLPEETLLHQDESSIRR